jgi:Mg2+-importing ATPase
VAVVVATGSQTELGRISGRLRLRSPETDFERGVRRFGYLLLEITLLLLVLTFAIHVYLHRPVLETFLFALALAVGLTPQLLPAIISVTLSFGAKRLADCEVVVRRLASIENFGSMNVLCCDKTGTITEGIIDVEAAIDPTGQPSQEVLQLAFVNASFETGFANPLDEAVRKAGQASLTLNGWTKQDEIPYDFLRKRITVLVDCPAGRQLITKGAVAQVLGCCTAVARSAQEVAAIQEQRGELDRHFAELSEQGFRLLAVATKPLTRPGTIAHDDERDMVFRGFLVLRDPPRKDAAQTLADLRSLGIGLKMITGDNRHVARHIAESIGWRNVQVLTGDELRRLSNEALRWRAERTDVFAEIEPNQKEAIIRALQRGGYVVGYLGDGINDATALHVADVGISVASAVDVAKETADIVLLRSDLRVLLEGVRQGRETFANTLKYVYLATSANLGNMLSMAVASVFLPFLPLLPRQVLLTNLLTDLPEMTIAHDRVDPEQVERPQRWDLRRIQRFMFIFAPLSSLFDMLTFATLIVLFHADEATFRTAWFIESVVSACAIVLVLRTRRPFWQSRPAWALSLANLGVMATTLALPYSPLAGWLAFSPLSGHLLLTMLTIALAYVAAAESAKRIFFRTAA